MQTAFTQGCRQYPPNIAESIHPMLGVTFETGYGGLIHTLLTSQKLILKLIVNFSVDWSIGGLTYRLSLKLSRYDNNYCMSCNISSNSVWCIFPLCGLCLPKNKNIIHSPIQESSKRVNFQVKVRKLNLSYLRVCIGFGCQPFWHLEVPTMPIPRSQRF